MKWSTSVSCARRIHRNELRAQKWCTEKAYREGRLLRDLGRNPSRDSKRTPLRWRWLRTGEASVVSEVGRAGAETSRLGPEALKQARAISHAASTLKASAAEPGSDRVNARGRGEGGGADPARSPPGGSLPVWQGLSGPRVRGARVLAGAAGSRRTPPPAPSAGACRGALFLAGAVAI